VRDFPKPDWGSTHQRIGTALLAIGLAIFFVVAFGPFAYALVAWLGLGDFSSRLERMSGLPDWYLILTILVVAGGEEWLYRCYAIEHLQDLIGSAWGAGALSLVMFAVVHYPHWGVGPALTTLISGGVLTIAYILTRDIQALIVAHAATDIYGLVVVP
jgi:membrane protease YdiL (CAAX protease family)